MPETQHLELWHRAMSAVRSYFSDAGLREVTTPVLLPAVAIEPYIEPVRSGDGYLATSPELPMKELLCHGSGPIFQIAPVFRRGENGARHRQEFRLVEWYRLDPDPAAVRADVVGLVEKVSGAIAEAGCEARPSVSWQTVRWLDALAETTGLSLRGDESCTQLRETVTRADPTLWHEPPQLAGVSTSQGRDLLAWTSFFTTWADRSLDPWLKERQGVHLVDFPKALAALSRVEGPTSARFESHIGDLELANGYGELTDAEEQTARFDAAQQLRLADGLEPLPMPRRFLEAMRKPGLPPCSGAALGLDRLVMWASGAPVLPLL